MIDTTHHHADNLLHGLNAQSASISDGIPLTLIQQKWRAGKRSFEQLQATLEWPFQGKTGRHEAQAGTTACAPACQRFSATAVGDAPLTFRSTGRS